MKTWTIVVMASLLGASQFGCSDETSGGGGGTCTKAFAACGGDLSGTWTIDGVCPEGDLAHAMFVQSGLPAACSDVYQSADMDASGTATFNNGVETSTVNVVITARIHMTAACLSAQAGGAPVTLSQPVCDVLATSMTNAATTDSPGSTTATCNIAGSACDCNLISDSGSLTDTTNYTVSGNTITDTADNSTQDFCVSGNTVTVREPNAIQDVAFQYTAHK